MKSVTVGEAQERLVELLREVATGEEIQLVQQQQPVAKLVPPDWENKPVDWAETWAKVDAVFGGRPAPGKSASQILIGGRR
ncbi:MAG: hypothetical protein HYY24_18060 [Verrucomicrobia bacterium]|nr:hypothetical protein [Verrucomicrobiota bacterium]